MIKRNLIANYFGQGWTALMGIVFVPLYIKYLGIESYGLIGIFTILQTGLSLLDAGITPTLNREMALFTGGARSVQSIRNLLRSVEVIILIMATIIISIVFLSADWLASNWVHTHSLTDKTVAQAFAIMGAVCAVRLIEGIYRSVIIGLQRQVLLNIIISSMASLRGVGAVVILVWVSPTIEHFFIWQIVVSLLTLLMLYHNTYQIIPKTDQVSHFSVEALQGIRQFAGGVLLIAFSSALLTQVDKFLLSRLLSLSDFGYYTFASLIASSLLMLVYPAAQVWYPKLSQMYGANNIQGTIIAYHQAAQLISVIIGSTGILLIVFSEIILELWTHDAELTHQTATLVSILTFGNILYSLMVMPFNIQLAYGLPGLRVKINFILVLVIVPAIYWVAPRYGAQGVAWLWVSCNIGYILISSEIMFRNILTTEKISWYIQDIFQPIVLAAGVAVYTSFLLPAQLWIDNKLVMLIIIFSLMLFAATYGAPLIRQQLKPVLGKLATLRTKF